MTDSQQYCQVPSATAVPSFSPSNFERGRAPLPAGIPRWHNFADSVLKELNYPPPGSMSALRDRHRLGERLLGEGLQGVVVTATLNDGRKVAVKISKGGSSAAYEAEHRALLTSVGVPRVPQFLESFSDAGHVGTITSIVEGQNLLNLSQSPQGLKGCRAAHFFELALTLWRCFRRGVAWDRCLSNCVFSPTHGFAVVDLIILKEVQIGTSIGASALRTAWHVTNLFKEYILSRHFSVVPKKTEKKLGRISGQPLCVRQDQV